MLPRVVVVARATIYDELLATHSTHGQAAFYLKRRGQDIDGVLHQHRAQQVALDTVRAAIPRRWRRCQVSRADLDRFLFAADDLVVAVGQDGLVANVAKYLDGQRVVGINPDPDRYDGVLVKHGPRSAAQLIARASREDVRIESRTMVEASTDDGQRLVALNEIFIGHCSHQSARYTLQLGQRQERQSSSGLIVASGTGATGWARSIHQTRQSSLALPEPESDALVFFVREAFPSRATGTSLVEGILSTDQNLLVRSEMNSGGVVFGDGVEADHIPLRWSQQLRVRRAERTLDLVA